MKIKMRGKVWELVRKRMRLTDGKCDNPTTPSKRIYINSSLKGERELDAIIHELIHAAHLDLAEEAVNEYSTDLARALWRIGYRKQNEKG